MSEHQGQFLWYELMTSDTEAAGKFYQQVVGWNPKKAENSDRQYTVWHAGDTGVGGLMRIPEDARGASPFWMGYIGVDDVDASSDRVGQAGGRIHRPPADIPGVGRFSVAGDPYGAVFALFKGTGQPPEEESGKQSATGTPGHIGWHELHAGDGPAAFDFYSKVFGWTKGEAMDMGPMGVYQLFSTGGTPSGAIMTKTPEMPRPLWLFYVNVEAADPAVEKIRQAGGRVLFGPHEVPGGSWIVQGLDPQAAMFALVAPKRSL